MPTGDPYCPICKSMIPCLHMRFGYQPRWEDEEKAFYGVEKSFYGSDINPKEEEKMDITPSDAIQHLYSKQEFEAKHKLTRAQEMAQLAETSRRKSASTYRYSLVLFIREAVEASASEGSNNLEFNSKHLPWAVSEIQAAIPFIENDGFTVVFETEMEKRYTTSGSIAGTGFQEGPFELRATNNKVLKISW